MVVGEHRATKLVINLAALQSNIKNEKKLLPASTRLFAVVKANAYGHGLVQVANAAVAGGADGLCVAILDEALELRHAGIKVPVLVLGITEPENAMLAQKDDISLTVGSTEWLLQYCQLLQNQLVTGKLKVHLALDTGMGRIGFRVRDEFDHALRLVQKRPFSFEGIFTHFATADEVSFDYFTQQMDTWHQLTDHMESLPEFIHVSNSATSLWHLPVTGNMIRFGIAMYGLNPSGRIIDPPFELQPVLSLVTKIDFVKQVQKGSSISYGATYQAKDDEWIGTIPLGYADGYPRRMQGFHVLVDGEFCEIVGRVCMDQMMIKLPHKMAAGTEVTLIGQQKGQQISCEDVAEYAHTINYEIMTSLATRLKREYVY
ncbi:alanine racemase [Paucilactobacillus kaifaensis]|uniref:alanine racemase n=1 Tax=Paucilactobacillus kaifaensis TaxID=2559921 RepID=UPI0010F5E68E|nr:alanine racemase [Paucilactobacillus kaifaensis]